MHVIHVMYFVLGLTEVFLITLPTSPFDMVFRGLVSCKCFSGGKKSHGSIGKSVYNVGALRVNASRDLKKVRRCSLAASHALEIKTNMTSELKPPFKTRP